MKYLKMLLLILMSLISSTSSNIVEEEQNQLYYKSSYEYVNEIGPQIIDCLLKNNRDGLKKFFCDKVKDTKYLDNEIDFLFDYIKKNGGLKIEGDYKKWTVGAEHGGNNSYSEKVINFTGGDYLDKMFIGNKEYKLGFSAYTILKVKPEYVGVLRIDISENIDFSKMTKREINDWVNSSSPKNSYLGLYIKNFNYKKFEYENMIPELLYKNEIYRYTLAELEEGHSSW